MAVPAAAGEAAGLPVEALEEDGGGAQRGGIRRQEGGGVVGGPGMLARVEATAGGRRRRRQRRRRGLGPLAGAVEIAGAEDHVWRLVVLCPGGGRAGSTVVGCGAGWARAGAGRVRRLPLLGARLGARGGLETGARGGRATRCQQRSGACVKHMELVSAHACVAARRARQGPAPSKRLNARVRRTHTRLTHERRGGLTTLKVRCVRGPCGEARGMAADDSRRSWHGSWRWCGRWQDGFGLRHADSSAHLVKRVPTTALSGSRSAWAEQTRWDCRSMWVVTVKSHWRLWRIHSRSTLVGRLLAESQRVVAVASHRVRLRVCPVFSHQACTRRAARVDVQFAHLWSCGVPRVLFSVNVVSAERRRFHRIKMGSPLCRCGDPDADEWAHVFFLPAGGRRTRGEGHRSTIDRATATWTSL